MGIHNPGKKHHAKPGTSWLIDMSVQNLCFDRLFHKKNDMKYFKNLIIVQILAISTQLFAYIQS